MGANIIKDVGAELKSDLKPAKLIATAVIIIGVLWALVVLSNKFGWFRKVNPLEAAK